jgi:uncharacterized membrane protein YhfC
MANPLLLLSGVGMIVVGLVFAAYFKKKLATPWKLFIYGGIVWFVAILIKGMMDVALTSELSSYLQDAVGVAAMLTLMGVYVGLRTGLLESGLTYLFAENAGIGKGFRKALSFGVGFGSAEAIFLGLSSLVNIGVLLAFPDIITALPDATREMVEAQLSMDTLAVIPPIIERVSVIAIHVFATLLVFLSLERGKTRYLLASIAFKSVVDGIIPWLAYLLDFSKLLDMFLAEVPVVILGLLSLWGVFLVKGRFREG